VTWKRSENLVIKFLFALVWVVTKWCWYTYCGSSLA